MAAHAGEKAWKSGTLVCQSCNARVRVRKGWLHRMHRAVYAVGHPNPPLEGQLLAAVKACGAGAVLSHFGAAALWGFLAWGERHPQVTVVGSATRVVP